MEHIKRLKHELVFNRYAWNIYLEAKSQKGIIKCFYILFGIYRALLDSHGNLWRYEKRIVMNKNIIYLSEFDTSIYVPNFKRDYLQRLIVRDNTFFSLEELMVLKNNFTRAGMVIIDVGANIGNHSLFFGNVCNAKRVYAFEPIESTYKVLERNVDINDLNDVIKTYNIALGSRGGGRRFNLATEQILVQHKLRWIQMAC